MAKKLSIEHQKVLNDFEAKMARKYGSTWTENRYDVWAGKGGRYKEINAVSKAISKASYGRRMATTTQEIVKNLMEHAPVDTTYGRTNMFRKIDSWGGLIVLGVEGATGGQMIGAPYMVHVNFTAKTLPAKGWIERAINSSEDIADAEKMIIWYPIYEYGMCAIKVRATENGLDDWIDDTDIEDLL